MWAGQHPVLWWAPEESVEIDYNRVVSIPKTMKSCLSFGPKTHAKNQKLYYPPPPSPPKKIKNMLFFHVFPPPNKRTTRPPADRGLCDACEDSEDVGLEPPVEEAQSSLSCRWSSASGWAWLVWRTWGAICSKVLGRLTIFGLLRILFLIFFGGLLRSRGH